MKCIICLGEYPAEQMTDEHIFPEAIGGRLLLKKSVCINCVGHLGNPVDSGLINNSLIEMARLSMNIGGKSGIVPNPMKKATLVEDPSHKFVIRLDKMTGGMIPQSVTRVTRTEEPGGKQSIQISVDKSQMENLPELVNKILIRSGAEPVDRDEIFSHAKHVKIEKPELHTELKVDIINYHRSMIKIAYELAYHWLGDTYLDDPTAKLLRLLIRDDREWESEIESPKLLRAKIDLVDPNGLTKLYGIEPPDHIGVMFGIDNTLVVYIRIFNMFEATILVSEDDYEITMDSARFIRISPTTGKRIESGLIEELNRLHPSVDFPQKVDNE